MDYRYAHLDGLTPRLTPVDLPASVNEACLRLAHACDLLFAGIDLKETPSGEFVCFEVNPCPGFLYYERHTGQPISTALAELLHGPHRQPSSAHTLVTPRKNSSSSPTHRSARLTIRDLVTILGRLGTRKDFWDGKDWQKDDFDGEIPRIEQIRALPECRIDQLADQVDAIKKSRAFAQTRKEKPPPVSRRGFSIY